jgi:hypothetical protein
MATTDDQRQEWPTAGYGRGDQGRPADDDGLWHMAGDDDDEMMDEDDVADDDDDEADDGSEE